MENNALRISHGNPYASREQYDRNASMLIDPYRNELARLEYYARQQQESPFKEQYGPMYERYGVTNPQVLAAPVLPNTIGLPIDAALGDKALMELLMLNRRGNTANALRRLADTFF